MSHTLYTDETPASVKEAKGLHLITQNTPNGKKVQIFLEELKDVYGTEWTTTLIDIRTNEQKKDWFLRLNPNGTSFHPTPTPTSGPTLGPPPRKKFNPCVQVVSLS